MDITVDVNIILNIIIGILWFIASVFQGKIAMLNMQLNDYGFAILTAILSIISFMVGVAFLASLSGVVTFASLLASILLYAAVWWAIKVVVGCRFDN